MVRVRWGTAWKDGITEHLFNANYFGGYYALCTGWYSTCSFKRFILEQLSCGGRTFTLEVGRFEVGDGKVAESFRVEAARIAGDEVAAFEPGRQPGQVTVAVEWVRQQVSTQTQKQFSRLLNFTCLNAG